MHRKLICLVFIVMAGCSSMPPGQEERTATAHSAYHHEKISEFDDGDTTFLQLVPNSQP